MMIGPCSAPWQPHSPDPNDPAGSSPPTPCCDGTANAFAERWIGSIRRELLDHTIIWNQQQLEQLVIDYIEHYNDHRPRRSLEQRPPLATEASAPVHQRHLQIVKSTRCDGLINEYRNAA